MKFSVSGLALTIAILKGGTMLVLGTFASLFGYGADLVDVISKLYFGYGTSFSGIITGTFWGLVDGFIAGALFAWIYNYFAEKK